ncbi:uroporphyrinogen-III C-methyltransferase [Sphingobium sp. CCH11-B1]|jgi:uroporphyrin-III C-methyltransferase|uniref:uroporphyrinogen-III C-methyltransferase n=1 Tax=Sphingobium sp. CCH11-B1 TaxID=1768781 RepID=UPI000834C964|nr:uroporphyrinogen-III C-methyltransferase [Sphingobium sp. CCH11-B1]MEA3390129.1 uroporphyrinogen-III C-methyltransferase [Pseudomonadota bacterium]
MPQNDLIAPGEVWLVGAGPGDPDLLTRKAENLIAAADIIFYDALVGPGVLDLIPPGIECISVGKRSGRHSKAQGSINDLLLAAAKAGRRVVRLKGGDPSIFGRSAEEMAHLGRAGVAVHICPGITTASAAAASGHMSLTLRGVARGLTLVTAHLRIGEPLALDWAALAGSSTLGIYMGRSAASEISRNLISAGRHPDTPVMVAVNVSLPSERLIRGKLSALAFLVEAVSDKEPTLLLVGEAVRNHGRAEAANDRALLNA